MFLLQLVAYLSESAFLLIAHVSGRSSFPKPLEPDKEKEMIERMLSGDKEAGKLLVEHNLRLVAHIAKKYANSGVDQDDLVSIGSIGLIKAVASFKPEAGKLTAYASRCVENEILMHLRGNKKNKNNMSLSDPIGSDREGNNILILDILGTDPNMVADQVEINIESARTLKLLNICLTPRERTVILLRYGLLDGIYHPQHEVAGALEISRSYVSRIEKRAIEKLYAALNKSDLADKHRDIIL